MENDGTHHLIAIELSTGDVITAISRVGDDISGLLEDLNAKAHRIIGNAMSINEALLKRDALKQELTRELLLAYITSGTRLPENIHAN